MATLLRGNNGSGAGSPSVIEANDEEMEVTPAPAADAPAPVLESNISGRTRDPLDPDEVATRRLYQASLFVADIMLLFLSTWLVFIEDKPLGFLSATAISLAVALGAWLASLAFWMDLPDV